MNDADKNVARPRFFEEIGLAGFDMVSGRVTRWCRRPRRRSLRGWERPCVSGLHPCRW